MSRRKTTVEYRPVPGFPRHRAGADGSIWVRQARRGLKSRRRVARWVQLVPRTLAGEALHFELWEGNKKYLRSARVLHDAAFAADPESQAELMGPDSVRKRRPERPLPQLGPPPDPASLLAPPFAHYGADNPRSKLDPEKVREIRRLRASGVTLQALARQFAVSQGTIVAVVSRRTWAHVAGPGERDPLAPLWTFTEEIRARRLRDRAARVADTLRTRAESATKATRRDALTWRRRTVLARVARLDAALGRTPVPTEIPSSLGSPAL